MSKPHRPPTGRTNLASCIVATIFLIFIVIVILIVFFTVFKPKDPKISVNAIQLPSFSVANNSVNFTFSEYVAVTNPNRASFSHYDSTIQLVYSGSQVGFMFIPAGRIDSGRTKYMAATFAVQSFPISSSSASAVVTPPAFVGGGFGIGGTNNGYRVGPTMEIESRMELAGRVRVLHFFTHHVKAKSAWSRGPIMLHQAKKKNKKFMSDSVSGNVTCQIVLLQRRCVKCGNFYAI